MDRLREFSLKKLVAVPGVVLALVFGGGFVASQAHADDVDTPDTVCVPKDAYTETIHHPAETHVERVIDNPGSPAIPGVPAIPAVPEIWANFSPNDQRATFIGPPVWPEDSRGTWHVHSHVPGGHADEPDGVYPKGNPAKGGNWFYKQAGKPAVPAVPEVPAVPPTYKDVVVVDKEASTEIVEHPAVTCPETETPTDPPTTDTPETEEPPVVVPETPEVPETPVNEPKEPKNKKTPASEALPETGA